MEKKGLASSRNSDGSRNENKILKGAQLQDEFDAIAGAVGNIDNNIEEIKQDLDNIEGGTGTGGVEEAPEDGQTYGRRDASWVRMASSIGGGPVEWDEIDGKPSEFPPEAHTQGWDTITDKPTEYPPESHTHEQSDVDGLEDRLEQIEDSITAGGGFIDAPNDGQLYGRQSEQWAVVPSGGTGAGMVISPTEPAEDDRVMGFSGWTRRLLACGCGTR